MIETRRVFYALLPSCRLLLGDCLRVKRSGAMGLEHRTSEKEAAVTTEGQGRQHFDLFQSPRGWEFSHSRVL